MTFAPIARLVLFGSIASALMLAAFAGSNEPKTPPISNKTRIEIIRILSSEYVWVRKPFPMGEKGLTINTSGELAPEPGELRSLLAKYGLAAKPGDRAQITNVEFKGKDIWFELNGGPKKKSKWYQRIQVGGSGGMTTPVPQNPNEIVAKGSYLVLQFKDYIPEVSLNDIKEYVKPVLDFTVKSAAQAYTETLPENVRNAIRDHKVLVGMNKEMVTYAKGRPPQRIRDREGNQDYEEWLFGAPPQDVEFIRFVGDEVIQVKTMTVDGQKIVKTQREVVLDDPSQRPVQAAAAETTAPKPRPAGAPTLRRAGEPIDDSQRDPSRGPVPNSPLPRDPSQNSPPLPPGQRDPGQTSPTPAPPGPPGSNPMGPGLQMLAERD
ncbi:MAG: hypothetical protein JWO20_963 [Candidatus Angelobacter sp.]|jgi:hypothetical protein|nr:hypothetical protein [Candidatus Angelobacter sp.]